MYHCRIATAVFFMASFAFIELLVAAFAWKLFGQRLWQRLRSQHATKQENENLKEKDAKDDNNNSGASKSRTSTSAADSVIFDAL